MLTRGDQRAVVTEVGATLRAYDVSGTAICWGFDEDELSTGGRGQVLAPWPNRIANGVYSFGGLEARVPLDEPEHNNAIHGLVRWMAFRPAEVTADSARLETDLLPQPAYPFNLALAIEYRLVPSGLEVLTIARNTGDRPAPFGVGFHDYLDAGPARVDGLTVDVAADRRLVLNGRKLPIGEEDVAGSAFAVLNAGTAQAPIGALEVDDCFGALRRGDDGTWRATIVRGAGALDTIELWADAAYKWAMVYTGDTLRPELRRQAIAVEPMTCPPDAFRSGRDVLVLAPGEEFTARWGIDLPGLR